MNRRDPKLLWLQKHFAALRARKKWAFLWRVWLEATIFAYLVSEVLEGLFHFPDRTDLNRYPPITLIALALLLGPLWETLVFQCLPMEWARSVRMQRFWRYAVSIAPFALGHRLAGIPTVVAAGLIGGFYFAFTYDRWRQESLFVAVVMTFLLHSSFNLVGVLGMLLGR